MHRAIDVAFIVFPRSYCNINWGFDGVMVRVSALAAAVATAAVLVTSAAAQTYQVVATGKTNGTTPDNMGVSLGHAYTDSNW